MPNHCELQEDSGEDRTLLPPDQPPHKIARHERTLNEKPRSHLGSTWPKSMPCPSVNLPTELIQRILLRSLPEPSWSSFQETSTTLRSVALVARVWTDWAQSELHRHVVLRDETTTNLWLESYLTERPKSEARTRFVQTLRIGGGTSMRTPPHRFDEVLARCGAQLQELWLSALKDVDLRQISSISNLRTLDCVDLTLGFPAHLIDFQLPIVKPSLQRLETLIIKDVDIASSTHAIMFQDHNFPRLEVLYVDSAEVLAQIFDELNPDLYPDENDDAVFPRLRMLSPASDLRVPFIYPNGLLFLNLEGKFFKDHDWSDDFPSLPTTIRYLRFDRSVDVEDMVDFLQLVSLTNLETIFLPIECQDPVEKDRFPPPLSKQWFDSRGVRIEYEVDIYDDSLALQDDSQPWSFLRRVEWVKARHPRKELTSPTSSQGYRRQRSEGGEVI
ncbi:BZ3500_MvSof-1268-A1-R1_Chr4-2g06986 [Microbotryum saponariae]|uniref:BZ3500_MvSof-1268-A1-R1_Chr4-2g06986 protein n=1 Tax=Microbotryum saponariae TaxID=289078 RepID=A0A2X0MWI4_9BASI|nr:BZ3500_MvSof-1268-A1-R1_Chr4-2g06986 [Microbotryum saponariae]